MSNKDSKGQQMWGGRFAAQPSDIMQSINASIDIDRRMAVQDIAGSRAHADMLAECGIISEQDNDAIQAGLDQVLEEVKSGAFRYRVELEDIHMNVEARLKEIIGEPAGRLHTARSRNDQVVTDFRLWTRGALTEAQSGLLELQKTLISRAGEHTDTVMPGFTHLQTEGLPREHLSQAAPEERLPVLLRPDIPMAPGRQDVGSIQGIVVEGIGDRASQLPAVAAQSCHRRLPSLQPALQRNRLRFPEQIRKLVQHAPDESSGPPGIVFLGRQLQHQTHQLTQPTARERKAHQRADAVGCRKLFPQPATGGPGVHHHLDRFHRPGTVLLELTGQQRSEKLSAIAAVKRQQCVASPARTLGTRSGSSGHGNESPFVEPRTCTTASVSGQYAESRPP